MNEFGCQWPVVKYDFIDGASMARCSRSGYGDYLPVCWQHAEALVDAAYDLIENHGHRLRPYPLTQMLEAINRAQPFGLDAVLVERIDGIRCGSYEMDTTRVIGDEFRAAVDRLLIAQIEAAVASPYSSPALNEALDKLLEKRLQEKWGLTA